MQLQQGYNALSRRKLGLQPCNDNLEQIMIDLKIHHGESLSSDLDLTSIEAVKNMFGYNKTVQKHKFVDL